MGHHHGSDTPTSARAVLLHTDQKGPNILTGSVGMYFDAAVVFVTNSSLFFRLAVAIL